MESRSLLFFVCVLLLSCPVLAGGSSDGSSGSSSSSSSGSRGSYRLPPSSEYASGTCIICFYADTEGLGHGFIKLWLPGARGPYGYGFYPGDDAWTPTICGGEVVNDRMHIWNWRICYNISCSNVSIILDKVLEWDNATYMLVGQNCVSFVQDVADALGIDIPDTGDPDRPDKFGESINESGNGQHNSNSDKSKDWHPTSGEVIDLTGGGTQTSMMTPGYCNPDHYVALANDAIGQAPPDLISLVGDQRVILHVTDPTHGTMTGGIILEGGRIVSITQADLLDPTLEVTAPLDAVSSIIESDDKATTFREIFSSGEIIIDPLTTGNQFTFGTAGFLARFDRIFNPPRFSISPGQTRNIIFKGEQSLLSMNRYNIRYLTSPMRTNIRIINGYGIVRGYSPTSYQRYIVNPSLSRSAGIYTRPASQLRGWTTRYTGTVLSPFESSNIDAIKAAAQQKYLSQFIQNRPSGYSTGNAYGVFQSGAAYGATSRGSATAYTIGGN